MDRIFLYNMILISGGTGFLAEELIRRLQGKNIRVVARNEGKLVALKEQFPAIEILTGDIADEWVARKAMVGITEVYHLAAFKHVGLAEENVFECISTNITGTLNLLKVSLETKPKVFLSISTDKAAQVVGVYGATKFLMERLIGEAERVNSDTKYRVVRYGNVLYSTGSVLCKWKEKIEKGEVVTVTDPNATRFFWTREEAVDLIFNCIDESKDSTPMIPEMKGASMGNVLVAMIEKYGNAEQAVDYIGLQPGENLHETMDGKVFSNEVGQFTVEELIQKV